MPTPRQGPTRHSHSVFSKNVGRDQANRRPCRASDLQNTAIGVFRQGVRRRSQGAGPGRSRAEEPTTYGVDRCCQPLVAKARRRNASTASSAVGLVFFATVISYTDPLSGFHPRPLSRASRSPRGGTSGRFRTAGRDRGEHDVLPSFIGRRFGTAVPSPCSTGPPRRSLRTAADVHTISSSSTSKFSVRPANGWFRSSVTLASSASTTVAVVRSPLPSWTSRASPTSGSSSSGS